MQNKVIIIWSCHWRVISIYCHYQQISGISWLPN